MGKPRVANRDTFHRMNFLHQAARLVVPTAPVVARNLSALAVAVARKAVLRVESRVKRAVCKRCAMPLVDGEGSSVRLRKKRLIVRCLACGFFKRYGLDKVPWGDRPEAVVATTIFDGQKREAEASNEVKDTRTKEERRMDKLNKRAEERARSGKDVITVPVNEVVESEVESKGGPEIVEGRVEETPSAEKIVEQLVEETPCVEEIVEPMVE